MTSVDKVHEKKQERKLKRVKSQQSYEEKTSSEANTMMDRGGYRGGASGRPPPLTLSGGGTAPPWDPNRKDLFLFFLYK